MTLRGNVIFDEATPVTVAAAMTQNAGDNGTLTQEGPGTVTLTGESTYSTTTIAAGSTLQIGNGGADGSIASDVTDNGTLVFNRSDALNFNNVVLGSGGVTQTGTGTSTFLLAQTYAGPTTVNGGTLEGGIANAFSAASATTINAGGTLNLGGFTPDDRQCHAQRRHDPGRRQLHRLRAHSVRAR